MTLLSPPRDGHSSKALPTARRTRSHSWVAQAAGQRSVALAGLGILVAGIFLGNPLLVLLALVASTTAAVRRWLPLDLAVPCAVLGLLAMSIVVGLAAALSGVDVFEKPRLVAGLYVCGAVATVAVGTRSRHFVVAPSRPWWVFLPAVVASATGLVQSFSLDAAKSWAFFGTDLVRHMAAIASVQRAGALDYGDWPYPRGLHTLAALASVPSAPVGHPAQLLGYDLQLTAGLTWCALGLMLWTGASLTVRLGQLLPVSPSALAPAALLLGLGTLLSNKFVFGFVYMGAAPSLLAVVVIWALPLALASGLPRLDRLPTTAALACLTAMLLAHLWQSLVVVPAVALALLIAPRIREIPAALRSRSLRRLTCQSLALALLFLGLAAVPVVSILHAGGVGLAATPGRFPGDPWALLLPGVVCTLPLLRRLRQPWASTTVGSFGGLVVTWVLMFHGSGYDVDGWYPTKTAWFIAVFLAPLLALTSVHFLVIIVRFGAKMLARTGRPAFVLQSTVVATALAVVGAFGLPTMMKSGSLTVSSWRAVGASHSVRSPKVHLTSSAERFDIAAKYFRDFRPAVVVPYYVGFSAVFDVDGTRLVSEILAFETGQPELQGEPRDICRAIQTLAKSQQAVVISKLRPNRVHRDMEAHGCRGRATVVQVPGRIGEVAFARQLARGNSGDPR